MQLDDPSQKDMVCTFKKSQNNLILFLTNNNQCNDLVT